MTMIHAKLMLLAPAALGLALPAAAQPAAQPPAQLSLEQRMLVRCSAAFALVAHGQENGNAQALQFPPMAERGREFFVRNSARVMDETGLDVEQIESVLEIEAQSLWDEGQIAAIMPVCLQLLDQSGL